MFVKVWCERVVFELIIIWFVELDFGNYNFYSVCDWDVDCVKCYFIGWMECDYGVVVVFFKWVEG